MIGLKKRFYDMRQRNQDAGLINRIKNIPDVFRHYCPNKKMIDNHQKKNLTTYHAGIIIALTKNFEENILTYSDGIDLLINYFNEREELFDIYPCRTRADVKEVIERKEVNRIWIFGHGWMWGLYFGKNDELKYSDFKTLTEEQKKDFIGQFHCNTDADLDSSLAAYILKPNGKKFIKKGYRVGHQNRLAIECCNKKNWDCNESCEQRN